MARYTGPSTKIARRFGEAIFGFDRAFEKRKYGPGQHGQSKKRKTKSEYSIQLMEKQKAKHTYGLLERQFSKFFDRASRTKGSTGENLLQMLEARLDNVVYRLGFSPSRRGARQLVSHKHISVNGSVVNIPSYQLKNGDVISIREKSKSNEVIVNAVANATKYAWLEMNPKELKGTFIAAPNRDQIPENIKEQLIVELYSK